MSTFVKTEANSVRAYVPTTALAKSLDFDEDTLHVLLTDGRRISVPLAWFPLLLKASPEQRTKYEIGGGGTCLHWPELDEDLSVGSLMAGADLQSS